MINIDDLLHVTKKNYPFLFGEGKHKKDKLVYLFVHNEENVNYITLANLLFANVISSYVPLDSTTYKKEFITIPIAFNPFLPFNVIIRKNTVLCNLTQDNIIITKLPDNTTRIDITVGIFEINSKENLFYI